MGDGKLKKWRLAIGKWLIDTKLPAHKVAHQTVKKILFVRYDGKIGDYIVSSFVYAEIKRQAPSVRLCIVASKANCELVNADLHFDEVLIQSKRSYFHLISTALKLRSQHFDVLFDATPTLRNRDLLFIRLVKAQANIGFAKEKYGLFNLNVPFQPINTAFIYQQMLEKLGFESSPIQYCIPNNLPAKQLIQEFIENKLQNMPFLVINLHGASRSRKLNTERSIQLIETALAQFPNFSVVLLTYPAINDWILSILQTIKSKRLFMYKETTSFFHSIYLIKKAVLVITPDTSVVHVADAFKKPLLAFYSKEANNFAFWRSIQPNTVIVRYDQNINELTNQQFENALSTIIINKSL